MRPTGAAHFPPRLLSGISSNTFGARTQTMVAAAAPSITLLPWSPAARRRGFSSTPRRSHRVWAARDPSSPVVDATAVEVNGSVGVRAEKRDARRSMREARDFPVLYDDGFGGVSVKDYLDWAKEIVKPDGGPPRWFCPAECGRPIDGAPLLLFLPGMDGTGLGLILHHRPLGKAFEVRCLHIPVNDRTSFEGLVDFVECTVRNEFASYQGRPIYLVGDSFGGCLALAVAARNPDIDLVLILSNPATSFGRSQLRPWLPIFDILPNELHFAVPYLLSFIMGDPVKLAMAGVTSELSPSETLDQLSRNLRSLLPRLSDLTNIIPRESLLWKIKLLRSASFYANSRLHAVTADVLLLCGGNDNMLPSEDEGKRLRGLLKSCRIRHFKENGHTLLLEDGINLMTIIKVTNLYRRSRKLDYFRDSFPPSRSEFQGLLEKDNSNQLFRVATSPVMLSTLDNGKIVRGLSGVPDEGPVLLVGNHMLMGLELAPLYEEFLKEKKVGLHGLAHPVLFTRVTENAESEISRFDLMKVFGALPVSPLTMYKLLSRKSFILLYPGGAREALHRKGEEYKLFWPNQSEFVRMAAQFEATIVPFGVVGEDDIAELALDYNDQMNIPSLRQMITELNQVIPNIRNDIGGEISNQELYFPGLLPKIPGRFYFRFGRPVKTKGLKEKLRDKDNAHTLYLQIKSEVENILLYLKEKRGEDPFRNIVQRAAHQVTQGPVQDFPSFEP